MLGFTVTPKTIRILAALATVAVTSAVGVAPTAAAVEAAGTWHDRPDRRSSFAVIGDIPYGDAALQTFPAAVESINDDPSVGWVEHLGDIKSGSAECTDAYFDQIATDFDRFDDPLVYTPGDNEWTDCHRPNNGAYDPLERLAKLREVFFDRPGVTLGRPMKVTSAAEDGYPENIRFTRDRVSFASVHIVGSNNGLAPQTNQTTPSPQQTAEVLGRTASTIATINEAFDTARSQRLSAVVIMTQADMFDPTVEDATFADYYAFQPIVAALANEASRFNGPVYVFNGDSHVYNDDRPLATGSSWTSLYGVTPTSNVRRVTVDGSGDANNYLRVTINPRARKDVLSWVKVPFSR